MCSSSCKWDRTETNIKAGVCRAHALTTAPPKDQNAREPRSRSAEDKSNSEAVVYHKLDSNTTTIIYPASVSFHVLSWVLPESVHLSLTRQMWPFPPPLSRKKSSLSGLCDHPRQRLETSFSKSRVCPSPEILHTGILLGKAPQASFDFPQCLLTQSHFSKITVWKVVILFH